MTDHSLDLPSDTPVDGADAPGPESSGPESSGPESSGPEASGDLTIDCSTCLARPTACGDCIVSVLLGPIEYVGTEERVAFAVLADSGLVPPLRLVRGDQGVA